MKVARTLLAALVLMVPLAACDNGDLPPASSFASVKGVVTDGTTNKPIAGAIVTVDTVLTATSDANGQFNLEKVPSGIMDFSVQAKGYKPVTSSVTAEPGKTFELNVGMKPPPQQ